MSMQGTFLLKAIFSSAIFLTCFLGNAQDSCKHYRWEFGAFGAPISGVSYTFASLNVVTPREKDHWFNDINFVINKAGAYKGSLLKAEYSLTFGIKRQYNRRNFIAILGGGFGPYYWDGSNLLAKGRGCGIGICPHLEIGYNCKRFALNTGFYLFGGVGYTAIDEYYNPFSQHGLGAKIFASPYIKLIVK